MGPQTKGGEWQSDASSSSLCIDLGGTREIATEGGGNEVTGLAFTKVTLFGVLLQRKKTRGKLNLKREKDTHGPTPFYSKPGGSYCVATNSAPFRN